MKISSNAILSEMLVILAMVTPMELKKYLRIHGAYGSGTEYLSNRYD